MTCINKLNKAITFGCSGGSVGLAELLLVNVADVANLVIEDNSITSITFYEGAKAYAVDCYKNGAKIVESMRTLDGAVGIEQTLTVTVYDKSLDGARIVDALLTGKYIAFGKLKDGGYIKVAGAYAGLESATADTDTSAAGGFTTVTLKTPDGSRGDRITIATTTVWDYLKVNEQTA